MKGKHNIEDIQKVSIAILKDIPFNMFNNSFNMLINRGKCYNDKQGNYFSNKQNCFLVPFSLGQILHIKIDN